MAYIRDFTIKNERAAMKLNESTSNKTRVCLNLFHDWVALDRTAHSYPMILCSKLFVSPTCQNQATWFIMSAQQLTLLAIVRNKPLSQAPPLWCHNALPWWRHIQNNASFRNLELNTLTHWGRDKMDAISQMTRSNAFSWMKMLEFRLKFHWSFFLRVQLTIIQHWFR